DQIFKASFKLASLGSAIWRQIRARAVIFNKDTVFVTSASGGTEPCSALCLVSVAVILYSRNACVDFAIMVKGCFRVPDIEWNVDIFKILLQLRHFIFQAVVTEKVKTLFFICIYIFIAVLLSELFADADDIFAMVSVSRHFFF